MCDLESLTPALTYSVDTDLKVSLTFKLRDNLVISIFQLSKFKFNNVT